MNQGKIVQLPEMRIELRKGIGLLAVILNAVDEKLGLTKTRNNRSESSPAGYPMRKPTNYEKH